MIVQQNKSAFPDRPPQNEAGPLFLSQELFTPIGGSDSSDTVIGGNMS